MHQASESLLVGDALQENGKLLLFVLGDSG
jgi:hypothetical protein